MVTAGGWALFRPAEIDSTDGKCLGAPRGGGRSHVPSDAGRRTERVGKEGRSEGGGLGEGQGVQRVVH